MENYFNKMMFDSFELLVAKKISWPAELMDSQKVALLQSAIEYFQELEDYEKCVILQNKINLIINGKPKRVIRKKKSLVAVKSTRKKKLPPTE